ncbi:tripartite motif-containing protein 16-like protein [Sebastes fasciatus]|uniref:tripartite motif-containing protein 16-like protein n=1 Tax=Sebastes fasciatus TaxID=394691 RepID=UPI003D9E6325
MALQGVQLYWETFSCSICLDLLKDPVTTSCGHSYCMNCIKTHWNGEDLRQINSCPQCRQTFTPRPVLMKNTMLADLVEELKKTGLQAGPADHCYAGSEDVACDKHKLVEPSKKLQEKEERTERQRELEVSRLNIQQRIQDREKDVKLLQQEVEAVNHSADKAVRNSEKIFNELIRLMEKRSCDLKQQVRSQQKSEVSRVKELQEKLEQEITELKRRDAELKLLSHTEDHNQFLRIYPLLSPLSESKHSSSINIRPLSYFEDVTAAVSEVRDKLQDILREKWTNVSQTVTEVDVLLPQPEPKTRAGFLQYSREITLDRNTANTQLLLSEGNRKATLTMQQQSYSTHPDRFTVCGQVLSRESLTGRCYWEGEWRGRGVYVVVAYKTVRRAGSWDECGFGQNDKSWALRCDNKSYIFLYSKVKTPVSGPPSSRIGVYLDHSAGILSFYSVSETMTLLHRVQTTFTEPLYAGLWLLDYDVTAELCKLK